MAQLDDRRKAIAALNRRVGEAATERAR